MAKTKSPELFWGPQFKGILREISRLAIALDIDVEQAGVGQRVIAHDETVCGRRNEGAFRQLREHLMALYELEEKSLDHISPDELRGELDDIWGAVLAYRNGDYSGARESWERVHD